MTHDREPQRLGGVALKRHAHALIDHVLSGGKVEYWDIDKWLANAGVALDPNDAHLYRTVPLPAGPDPDGRPARLTGLPLLEWGVVIHDHARAGGEFEIWCDRAGRWVAAKSPDFTADIWRYRPKPTPLPAEPDPDGPPLPLFDRDLYEWGAIILAHEDEGDTIQWWDNDDRRWFDETGPLSFAIEAWRYRPKPTPQPQPRTWIVAVVEDSEGFVFSVVCPSQDFYERYREQLPEEHSIIATTTATEGEFDA